ncbi:hypothetical protein [Streptomyces sp. 061-3]|uniref:hypothetical protein n=1 Tax=Streptomyces sp. 061-3 TaxID=2789268 RepID=UPI00397EE0CE
MSGLPSRGASEHQEVQADREVDVGHGRGQSRFAGAGDRVLGALREVYDDTGVPYERGDGGLDVRPADRHPAEQALGSGDLFFQVHQAACRCGGETTPGIGDLAHPVE